MFGGAHTLVPERRGERFSSECGASRARDELGWIPVHDLDAYVKDFKNKNKL